MHRTLSQTHAQTPPEVKYTTLDLQKQLDKRRKNPKSAKVGAPRLNNMSAKTHSTLNDYNERVRDFQTNDLIARSHAFSPLSITYFSSKNTNYS